MALENENFSFSQILFSQLWRTLARKLMKRLVVFIAYFQSSFQIVHVYQVLRSELFLQKFYDPFNLISIFFTFNHFSEKTYEKTDQFYDLFLNLFLLCTRSKNLVIWKFLLKKLWLFQNLNNFFFICSTLSNICEKTMKRPTIFFTYFETSTSSLHANKISWSPNFCTKNVAYFNMSIKLCLFQQLWTIFTTKIIKKSYKICKYFWSSIQFSNRHALLLWPNFYNKNDKCYNVANKLIYFKRHSLPPIFKIFFYLPFNFPNIHNFR